MRERLFVLGIAAALLFPFTQAHDDPASGDVAGTPDTTCEVGAEWADHDYGPPALGLFIQGLQESNLEDCDGDFDETDPFCYLEEILREDVDGPLGGDPAVCERFDDDGHDEYTRGGAWLLVNTGDGVTGGTQLCFGRDGHHPNFGPVTVADVVFGLTVPFTVEADLEDATGLNDPCGDFQSDVSTSCVGTCVVPFPAGLDGSYQVYVGFGAPGTQGHVCSGGGDCDFGEIERPECSNGFDDDGDGRTDWPRDPDCESPLDDDESGNAPEPPVSAPYPSVAAIVFDDEQDADPTVVVAPGWECTSTSTPGSAEVECNPDLSNPVFAASHPLACQNPSARAGGSAFTTGSATASVTCGGVTAGPCNISWTASSGICEVTLPGHYHFPLRCNVSANGQAITPGAKFFAECNNGHP